VLTFDQIKELIEMVGRERLNGLEIERSGFRLKIDGRATETVAYVTPAASEAEVRPVLPVVSAPIPASATADSDGDQEEGDGLPDGVHILNSPIVGTFYTSPSPDSDSYVAPGDRVKTGQVLCIVEAMKLMNEIESDVDGVVVKILPKNAQPVEFGEPLFAIQPD